MPYSIELFFDPESSSQVHRLWAELAAMSGSRHMLDNGVYPHLALAVFESDGLPSCLETGVEALAKELSPQCLKPYGIGSFAGERPVVYLGFETCRFLSDIHGRVEELLGAAGLNNHAFYRADRWVPHCTLAMAFPPSRHSEVVEAASRSAPKAAFEAISIGLIQYPPTVRLWACHLADGRRLP